MSELDQRLQRRAAELAAERDEALSLLDEAYWIGYADGLASIGVPMDEAKERALKVVPRKRERTS